jgi:hypothetical protein
VQKGQRPAAGELHVVGMGHKGQGTLVVGHVTLPG